MQNLTASRTRISSVDYARGVIMLIMAIDHVRDYFHITASTADPLNLETTTPALFFTRWITHFCAPGFLFLSGVSVWLSSNATNRKEKSVFLIKRGIFIALFDVLVMSLIMSFNPKYNFVFITVLWAIGCSMILLGVLMRFAPKLILPLAIIILFGHDAMTNWLRADPVNGNGFLRLMFTGVYFLPVTQNNILAFLYSIIPWTGVMLLGYSAAAWIKERKKMFLLGAAFLILFIVLRSWNVYGDIPYKTQSTSFKTFLAFINTSKYPPSLLFICMTLSGICFFLGAAKESKNAFQRFASVYGRVPFFFFVMHFFLAHIFLVIAFYATGHTSAQIVDANTGILFRPQQFGFELPIVYAVWLAVVLLLYYPCIWFYNLKKRNSSSWLRYV